ncbi:hypothetical protein K439DRAFT_601475 [Ramaria rubella]|nr:hypothetical protein K439DRAFT_601475 [Ramaria rubella]
MYPLAGRLGRWILLSNWLLVIEFCCAHPTRSLGSITNMSQNYPNDLGDGLKPASDLAKYGDDISSGLAPRDWSRNIECARTRLQLGLIQEPF